MWQPIETAPKDGTPILGYSPNARGMAVSMPPIAVVEWVDLGEGRFGISHDDGAGSDFRPTHWMPLPAAPDDRSVTG
jgi:hypothetical protein